jgi:CheY-specific phosphatase CheX
MIIGTVTYAGDWQGLLRIECSVFDAIQLVHRLLGPCEDVQSHAVDFIGELTNMVAGNLRPLLPRGADTDVPQIVVTERRPMPFDADYQVLQQRFTLENGSVTVSFVVEKAVP